MFFATHEPCSLCKAQPQRQPGFTTIADSPPANLPGLSGITWSGFDNHYYLFTYEDTRDLFSIPYDIAILEQVFKVRGEGESAESFAKKPLYNKKNDFWTVSSFIFFRAFRHRRNCGLTGGPDNFQAKSVADLIGELPAGEEKDALVVKMNRVRGLYGALSETYQSSKGDAGIPLA